MESILIDFHGSSWSGWTNIGGATTSGGALASYNGKLYAIVRGTDNGVYVNKMTNWGSWSGWSNIGGATTAEPTAVVYNNRLFLSVRGTDDKVYLRSLSGETWTDWVEVPGNGRIISGPSLVTYQNDLYLDCPGNR